MEKVIVRFIDLFSGTGPEVGEFIIDNDQVNLEIHSNVSEIKDTFLPIILKSMKNKIKSRNHLDDLIKNNSPYSSLQFFPK